MMRLPARSSICALVSLLALSTLGACHGAKPTGGGTVAMHDMEVVDGTANDSMVDLDNATQDGTLLSNAGGLPGAVPMGSAPSHPASAAENSSAPTDEKSANASAPQ